MNDRRLNNMNMRRSDFYYELPPELIAAYPLAERSASRLLGVNVQSQPISHFLFNQLTELLEAGDLLVFNDSRVIPARLFAEKNTGGKVEILVERILTSNHVLAQVRASKSLRVSSRVQLKNAVEVEVIAKRGELYELYFVSEQPVLDILRQIGHMPIPPYFNRPDEDLDQERYQTIYARYDGSVAAPTAGLHFDENLLNQLQTKGVQFAFVTLHVGAGTFKPLRVDNIAEHVMHYEYVEVSAETCEQIKLTKQQGKRVIAVGTTSVRSLETASQSGSINPYVGETNLFIYPGYRFQCVDALITNFHLPESTLLMLVCALGGYKRIMQAYREAVKQQYRFFSYGDAMIVMSSL